jgi:hypothetical protein
MMLAPYHHVARRRPRRLSAYKGETRHEIRIFAWYEWTSICAWKCRSSTRRDDRLCIVSFRPRLLEVIYDLVFPFENENSPMKTRSSPACANALRSLACEPQKAMVTRLSRFSSAACWPLQSLSRDRRTRSGWETEDSLAACAISDRSVDLMHMRDLSSQLVIGSDDCRDAPSG